jgi:hypothetical protein
MIYKYSGSFRGILMEINYTVPIVDELLCTGKSHFRCGKQKNSKVQLVALNTQEGMVRPTVGHVKDNHVRMYCFIKSILCFSWHLLLF